MLRLMIAVFFGDSLRAKESRKIGREHLGGVSPPLLELHPSAMPRLTVLLLVKQGQGLVYTVFFQLFEAISLYEETGPPTSDEREYLRSAHELLDNLAVSQPDNFLPLKLWLDAERLRAAGSLVDSVPSYDLAIEAATGRRAIHLAACMNERAAACLPSAKLRAGCAAAFTAPIARRGADKRLEQVPHRGARAVDGVGLRPQDCQDGGRAPAPFPVQALVESALDPDADADAASSAYRRFGNDYMQSRPSSNDTNDQSSSSTGKGDELNPVHNWMSETVNGDARRRMSHGSHGSHSHDGDIVSQTRSLDHSDVYGRSHLATELDLRTVVTASSVISGELSVDTCAWTAPLLRGQDSRLMSLSSVIAASYRSCSICACAPPVPRSASSSSTRAARSVPRPSRGPTRATCSTFAAQTRSTSNLSAVSSPCSQRAICRVRCAEALCAPSPVLGDQLRRALEGDGCQHARHVGRGCA